MLNVGSIVCAKNITHRDVVEVKEDKNGKQRVSVNQFGFKFQSEHNLLSQVGVFIYLGRYPEANGAEAIHRFAEQQLRALGWTTEQVKQGDTNVPVTGATDVDG